jgi:hypothetical protein
MMNLERAEDLPLPLPDSGFTKDVQGGSVL